VTVLIAAAQFLAVFAVTGVLMWAMSLFIMRHVRRIARQIAAHMDDEMAAIDHVIRIMEDLARIEPERAEMFEVTRLELLASQERQRENAVVLKTAGGLLLPWRVYPDLWRVQRGRWRRKRSGGAA
jgi:biopolymer transport protein ExbB/TolQ